jgi:heterodisulfide reductase subunit B
LLTKEEAALKLSMDLLTRAKEAGADCIITACPLCHMLLDAKQATIEAKHNTKIDIPVLYFTQLIGLALGIKPKELGLDKNLVSPRRLVERF